MISRKSSTSRVSLPAFRHFCFIAVTAQCRAARLRFSPIGMPSPKLCLPVPDKQHILNVATSLAAQPLSGLEHRPGGGNNRLFRAHTVDGGSYALKEYPRRANDPRDRLTIEYGALKFLGRHKSISVPHA